MPFTQDEAIAIRPVGTLRINSENATVEDGEQLGDGKARPEMRTARAMNHFERIAANKAREIGELRVELRVFR